MALLDRILTGRIHKGSITINRSDGSSVSYGKPTDGWPEVVLHIHKNNAERRILTNPRLGMAETFMDGSVSVENEDIMGLVDLIRRNNIWELGGEIGDPQPIKKFFAMLMKPFQQLNSLANSRSNVAHHYDVSNDFYKSWLDEDMQYSCAYWPDADVSTAGPAISKMTLEEAQMAKKAHIAAKLNLKPGHKVLDIGCGWGGMALYIARVADVSVHGITLSVEQHALAVERAEKLGLSDRVTFELVDYRDHAKREVQTYDRIVSVGMFEHVGVPQFETFFRCVSNLMKDDGVMLLHTIGRLGVPGSTDAFTRKYIFPGGYIPALSETIDKSEKVKLIASDIENWRVHYALTLREWDKRVREKREEIIAQYDDKFYRMWIFYLAGATAAFESGGMNNYQIQYIRNRRALPLHRNYITDNEQAYMKMHTGQ